MLVFREFTPSLVVLQSESLQKHLDIVNNDLKMQERKFRESQRNLQLVDEDLVSFVFDILSFFVNLHKKKLHFSPSQATTRINYEEQISVLTEQVISLSDQLAELK